MKNILKNVLITVSVLLLPNICHTMDQIKTVTPDDSYELLNNLLLLTDRPEDIEEKLAQYNKWANIYDKYHKKKILASNDIKIYLFINFIAEERVMVHTMEEIHIEIVSKFERQPEQFLSALKELKFLIPSTCNAINGHFNISNTVEKKKEFIERYRSLFNKYLGDRIGKECILTIEAK